jgi:hypothetical protein
MSHDIDILRRLSGQVAEISQKTVQDERRDLWRRHNSLQRTRIPVLVRWGVGLDEIIPQSTLECEDPFFRAHERMLKARVFQDFIGDDTVAEPWITQRAVCITPPEGLWGVPLERIPKPEEGGSWKDVAPLKRLEDIDKLISPHHVINEQATAHLVDRLQQAVGDILEINLDRQPIYHVFSGDISSHLAYLRGLEQIMWDMSDNPEWLHRLLAFMRDGILTTHEEAEQAGDWRLCDHENQAMPYALELPNPRANSESVTRDKLWIFMQAQELTQISPRMFDEFMLQYQLPIVAKFGLVAYGCCEDLTHKIKYLRQIPNLRRIAVTPWADLRACAEQIQQDYVYSWRPNPAEMVCGEFNPDWIRQVIREGLEVTKDCIVDITLKDVKTVRGHPENLREWVNIVRQTIDHHAP